MLGGGGTALNDGSMLRPPLPPRGARPPLPLA
jgi:hypothetical protein